MVVATIRSSIGTPVRRGADWKVAANARPNRRGTQGSVFTGPGPDVRGSAADRPLGVLSQIRSSLGWVGAGGKLTRAGRLTLADERMLVDLLDTGNVIEPVVWSRVFPTKSSKELRYLNLLVEWAVREGPA